MPRRPRFDLPNTVHHITIRGVERRVIFIDDPDHFDLLRRFDRWRADLGATCLAWSLVFNHLHLVILRSEHSLAELMARFSSAFAQGFNRRYGRVGHLFQGRYKSRLIEHDEDLRWMIAYTLGNPVRHGITSVEALARYRWSGYGAAMGVRPAHAFESCGETLRAFDDDAEHARAGLRETIEQAAANQWSRQDPRLAALIAQISLRRGIGAGELRAKSPAARAARPELVASAVHDLHIPRRELAAQLGISRAAVDRALTEGARARP